MLFCYHSNLFLFFILFSPTIVFVFHLNLLSITLALPLSLVTLSVGICFNKDFSMLKVRYILWNIVLVVEKNVVCTNMYESEVKKMRTRVQTYQVNVVLCSLYKQTKGLIFYSMFISEMVLNATMSQRYVFYKHLLFLC